jgi:hypothetical protein
MAYKVVPSLNSNIGTNYQYASAILRSKWVAGGGDYLDTTGTLNGPTPTITQAGAGTTTLVAHSINISTLPPSDWLMVRSCPYLASPKIDGIAVEGVWTAPASINGLALPADSDPTRKILLKRPSGGGTTLTFDARANSQTIKVDRVKQPEIADPTYTGPTGAAASFTLDLSSESAMFTQVAAGSGIITGRAFYDSTAGRKWTGSAEFGVDPLYGFNYVRMGSFTDSEIIMVVQPKIDPPLTDIYFRYLIMLEDDIADGMPISGLKLPGIRTSDLALDRDMSWRMWHGGNDPANRGIWWFGDYMYSFDMPGTTPNHTELTNQGTTSWYRSNRWHCVEGRAKNNTSGIADGIATIWFDGVQIYHETDRNWRGTNTTGWDWGYLWMNIFHGGQDVYPTQPIHYRIAEASWGTARMGVPQSLLNGPSAASHTTILSHLNNAKADAVEISSTARPAIDVAIQRVQDIITPPGAPPAWPLWRQNLPVGQWIQLPTAQSLDDAMQVGSSSKAAMLRRQGFAYKNGALILALASGANDPFNEGWQNNVIYLDLMVDNPQWVSLHAGTSLATLQADGFPSPAICSAYYSDGLPCGRRTFFSQHYSPIQNKTFVVGSYEAAAINTAPTFAGGGQLDAFNHANNTWAASGTHPSCNLTVPASMANVWTSCMDRRTGDIFVTYLKQFRRYTQSTGLWTTITPTGLTSAQQVVWSRGCFVDEALNEVVYHTGFHNSPSSPHGLVFLHINTSVGRFVEIPSTIYSKARKEYSTMVKNLDSGKYEFIGDQVRRGNFSAPILQIDPANGNCTQIDNVPAPVGGACNRYVYLSDLKCIAYQPADGNLMIKPTAGA